MIPRHTEMRKANLRRTIHRMRRLCAQGSTDPSLPDTPAAPPDSPRVGLPTKDLAILCSCLNLRMTGRLHIYG